MAFLDTFLTWEFLLQALIFFVPIQFMHEAGHYIVAKSLGYTTQIERGQEGAFIQVRILEHDKLFKRPLDAIFIGFAGVIAGFILIPTFSLNFIFYPLYILGCIGDFTLIYSIFKKNGNVFHGKIYK